MDGRTPDCELNDANTRGARKVRQNEREREKQWLLFCSTFFPPSQIFPPHVDRCFPGTNHHYSRWNLASFNFLRNHPLLWRLQAEEGGRWQLCRRRLSVVDSCFDHNQIQLDVVSLLYYTFIHSTWPSLSSNLSNRIWSCSVIAGFFFLMAR